MSHESAPSAGESQDRSATALIHYVVLTALAIGGLIYWWTRPPGLNPMLDRQAAEALALVQTHPAQGYPTLLQAMNEHARMKTQRGEGIRLGEWRVIKLDTDLYEVRLTMREQGKTQWFEREFIWHANLTTKQVNAASLPADGLMPAGSAPALPPGGSPGIKPPGTTG
jgi:hypothetical protein